jgi:hypothetical protein
MDNGSPILAGIFRQFTAPTFPTHLDPFYIACEVEVDPPQAGRSYFLDLLLSDEDGRVLFTEQLEVEFQRRPDGNPSFCYIAGRIHVLSPIEKPGLYRFDLLFNDDAIGQVRLEAYSRE